MNQLLITIAAVVLVGCGPSASDISIYDAAAGGLIKAIKQHLAAGANINQWTPLHHAALHGQKESIEILIAEDADVNVWARINTPLHYAVQYGEKEIVELFISKGAHVNPKDYGPQTPLDRAVEFNHPEIANLLRKHGAKTAEELKAEGK